MYGILFGILPPHDDTTMQCVCNNVVAWSEVFVFVVYYLNPVDEITVDNRV